jgi:hypothetical protein
MLALTLTKISEKRSRNCPDVFLPVEGPVEDYIYESAKIPDEA